jgi:hypothetical protein
MEAQAKSDYMLAAQMKSEIERLMEAAKRAQAEEDRLAEEARMLAGQSYFSKCNKYLVLNAVIYREKKKGSLCQD